VEIMGENGQALPERHVGEIVVEGPSVARGYFGDETTTRTAFRNGKLFTGDLGYFADGKLHVCGRSKDIIILRGRNYYPQDIEKIISEVEGVRTSQVAVFTCPRPNGNGNGNGHGNGDGNGTGNGNGRHSSPEERLVAVAEVSKVQFAEDAVRQAIVAAVHQQMGLRVDEVHFLRRGGLPKTSSGKVRRRETRDRLQAGTLALALGSEE